MSIVVENVTKIYGTQRAIDNVSFSVQPGEIVGLLGPNGAGKSTMMKMITCFIPQNEGKITVCGFDVKEDPLKVKQKIGYLPEQNPLYLEMYVREYLEFIGRLHKIPKFGKKNIDNIIERTGLGLEQKKKIGVLSKGYKQRVGLAQALIHDPEVLILDEPTTGLDPNQIIDIRNLIVDLGRKKTVILSTHIMQEVEAICSRSIIINKGKVVADAPTYELANLIGSTSVLTVEFNAVVQKNKILAIKGVTGAEKISEKIWKLTVVHEDIRQHVFEFAVHEQIAVLSMNVEKRKLEEVFQSLTQR